ncbi:MAG: phosphatase PAP2 family protein [Verrucomicrobiota bacterium]
MLGCLKNTLHGLAKRWSHQPLMPALALVILVAVWGFTALAGEVMEKETHDFDEFILLAMREPGDTAAAIGPPWLGEMARDITALGGFTLLTGVTVIATGVALLSGKPRLAVAGVISVVLGSLLVRALKYGYNRPRPDLIEHAMLATNPSFPSGHSTMAALVWLTLGMVIARTQPRHRVRVFVVAISVVITLLVGVSRVYLGVHWPTDVLAGWTLGGAWAALFWMISIRIDHRAQRVSRTAVFREN